MAEEKTVELSDEEVERLKKALSWNDGQGYDSDGPADICDVIEVDYVNGE